MTLPLRPSDEGVLVKAFMEALPDALANATELDETYDYSCEPGSPYVMILASSLAEHPVVQAALADAAAPSDGQLAGYWERRAKEAEEQVRIRDAAPSDGGLRRVDDDPDYYPSTEYERGYADGIAATPAPAPADLRATLGLRDITGDEVEAALAVLGRPGTKAEAIVFAVTSSVGRWLREDDLRAAPGSAGVEDGQPSPTRNDGPWYRGPVDERPNDCQHSPSSDVHHVATHPDDPTDGGR